jgi:hypothetical protein
MTDYTIKPCKGRDLDAGGNCRCGCGYNSDWAYGLDGDTWLVNAVPATSERQAVLDEAGELIHGPRNQGYGNPQVNFQRIADFFNVFLQDQLTSPIQPHQIGWLSMFIKAAREMQSPKRDNYVDAIGYLACSWEVKADDSSDG